MGKGSVEVPGQQLHAMQRPLLVGRRDVFAVSKVPGRLRLEHFAAALAVCGVCGLDEQLFVCAAQPTNHGKGKLKELFLLMRDRASGLYTVAAIVTPQKGGVVERWGVACVGSAEYQASLVRLLAWTKGERFCARARDPVEHQWWSHVLSIAQLLWDRACERIGPDRPRAELCDYDRFCAAAALDVLECFTRDRQLGARRPMGSDELEARLRVIKPLLACDSACATDVVAAQRWLQFV